MRRHYLRDWRKLPPDTRPEPQFILTDDLRSLGVERRVFLPQYHADRAHIAQPDGETALLEIDPVGEDPCQEAIEKSASLDHVLAAQLLGLPPPMSGPGGFGPEPEARGVRARNRGPVRASPTAHSA